MHPLAQHFASVADVYDYGRPDYAPAVVGAMAAELRILPGAAVLDLAAGTGKLTRALVAGGFEVVAVEPQAALRAVLAGHVGAERVRDGLAEEIPLPDDSIHVVTVADGFHWFDRPKALQEIRRVLRPAGGLALLNTVPDWRKASWAHELGTIVNESRPEHPNFDGPPWREFIRAAEGWSEPWEVRVTTHGPADVERIVAHMASISWMAGMSAAERDEILARMRTLMGEGETPDTFPLHVDIGLARLSE